MIEITVVSVICFVLNAIARILQVRHIRQDKSAPATAATRIGAFALINGLIALMLASQQLWIYGLMLGVIFPLLTGLYLAWRFRNAPGSRKINIAILVLDLLCVLTTIGTGYLIASIF